MQALHKTTNIILDIIYQFHSVFGCWQRLFFDKLVNHVQSPQGLIRRHHMATVSNHDHFQIPYLFAIPSNIITNPPYIPSSLSLNKMLQFFRFENMMRFMVGNLYSSAPSQSRLAINSTVPGYGTTKSN